MRLKLQISKVGGSYIVKIPSVTRDMYNLDEGDEILIDIIEKVDNNIKKYRCRRCQHQFETDDEFAYCTACQSTSLEKLEEVKIKIKKKDNDIILNDKKMKGGQNE